MFMKKWFWNFPGGALVKTAEAGVRSLVRELRSHMLSHMAKKKNSKCLFDYSQQTYDVGTIIIPILHTGKLKPRELSHLPRVLWVDLNPGSSLVECKCSTTMFYCLAV